ncbi:MAG: DNA polymerase III subunit delta [Patescibacteria group bacterium]
MSAEKIINRQENKTTNNSIQLWYGEDQSLLSWEADWWRREFKTRQPQGLIVRLSYQDSNEQELLLQLQQSARGGNLWSSAVYLELADFLNLPAKSSLADLLLSIIEEPPENLFLLMLETNKPAWSKAWPKKVRGLIDKGCLKQRDFLPATSSQRLSWLQKLAKELSVDLPVQSARALLNRGGLNCWRLSQELNKLAAFVGNQSITVADIDLLVEPVLIDSSFALLEALGKRDIKQATAIMDRLLKAGDSPQSLIGLLTWNLRVLTGLRQKLDSNGPTNKLSARELAVDLGLHPFVVNKALQQMPYYSALRIKELWSALTEVDIKLKTSTLPPDTILSLFFVKMCKTGF